LLKQDEKIKQFEDCPLSLWHYFHSECASNDDVDLACRLGVDNPNMSK